MSRLYRLTSTLGLTSSRLSALAAALLVVSTVFPDVIFQGASFRNSRVLRIFDPKPATTTLYGETADRAISDGYRDLGSASWQLEPAQRFLRNCIENGESPYWNPYSASGTVGPERMASASFSSITLATALLGGGTGALHAVLLLTFVMAVYGLYRSLTTYLKRGRFSALVACYAFLLTGFHTSMLGAQMVQPYLLAPLLLLALLALWEKPGLRSLVLATLATALLFAETFVPTTALSLIAIHLITLVHGVSSYPQRWRSLLGQQALASVLGLLLVAPIWFPVVENIPMTDWSEYESRRLETVQPIAALSVATPKHFWESYGAFQRSRSFQNDVLRLRKIDTSRVYHLGVLALFCCGLALAPGGRSPRSPIAVVCAVLAIVGLGRVFGVPPLDRIHDLPLFGSFAVQYWGLWIALSSVVLISYGLDRLEPATVLQWPTALVTTYLAASAGVLYSRLGLPTQPLAGTHIAILTLAAVLPLPCFLLVRWRPRATRYVVYLLGIALICELVFYMNRTRPLRTTEDPGASSIVQLLQSRLDDHNRVLNVGARGLHPNWGSALGIPQMDSLDSVNLRWYSHFFSQRIGRSHQFLALKDTRPRTLRSAPPIDHNALDLLAVQFIIATGPAARTMPIADHLGLNLVDEKAGVRLYENPSVLPRAQLLPALLEAPGLPTDWSLDPTRVVTTTDREFIREARRLNIPSKPPKQANGEVEVEILSYHHDRVAIRTEAQQPSILVLADTWHPTWRVAIDDQPAQLARANEVVRAVALPAGRHEVLMTYRPRSLMPALVLSGLAMLSLLTLAIVCRRAGWPGYRVQST